MRIAVCTNDPAQARHLQDLLEQIGREFRSEVSIESYTSCRSLSRCFQAGSYHAMLLDADMPDCLEAAQEMICADTSCKIILFGELQSAALLAYRIHPEGFLPKPVQYVSVRSILNWLRQSWYPQLRCLHATVNRVPVHIAFMDIFYVEVLGPMLTIHGKYGILEIRMPMARFAQEAEGNWFLRCHRSYLVNLFSIRSCEKDHLLLWDGSQIPVSEERMAAVRTAFAQFRRENLLALAATPAYS